ncbi:MAG: fibronectin type III domain-containing protein [Ruminococcus sp.]
MKNSVKRTTAAILAAMMIGTGIYAPTADHYNLFSETSITAEAASVGKVTGLKSNTLSNSKIKLKWKKVKGASGYTVYMRKNGKYNKVADAKSTTYTVKKLPNATRENFKVRAYKKVKGKKIYGSYSSNWNTATNPQPCKGLKVSSVNSDSVKLSWTKIGCTNYRVFQYIGGEWKEIGKTTGTSYTVKKLTPQTEYQFKIRACKKDDKKKRNNHYGKHSKVVTVTTSVAKVTGVQSNTLSNSEISLSWNSVSGADGYSVGMRKDGVYNEVADVTETNAVVSGLPNATRESFKIRAYSIVDGSKQYGNWSDSVATATAPQKAKGLNVSSVTESSVTLSWDKIGCNEYVVYEDNGESWSEIGRTADTQFTAKNLNAETSYNFKIQAVKIDDAKVEHYGEESDVVKGVTSRSDKITQADIDAMKKELQEYSNSKADFIRENYTEFDGYGTEYNTVDEFFERCVRNYTPDNSSYSSVYIIPTDETDIEEVKKQLKNKIDYGYRRNEDVNFVVYIDNCPNGLDIYNGSCWAVYLLY